MLPTLVFPRLTALALVAGLGLSQTPIAQAADAPASSESGASASIRPTLDKPTFFKRKEVAKEAPKPTAKSKPEAQGVSMSELADLIDQKIAEVAAKRTPAPVVKVKSQAPKTKRVAATSGAALTGSAAAQDPLEQRLLQGREVDWAYSGATGPDAWGQLKPAYRQCMLGKRQSPIDIRDGLKVYLDPIQFDYRPTRFRVIDTGRTVQVNLDLGNSITVMGQRYELVQMQFHRPSEERVNGRAYPMSAQLLHKSPAGQIAVVREVMADLGVDDIPVIGVAKGPDRDAGLEGHLRLRPDSLEINAPRARAPVPRYATASRHWGSGSSAPGRPRCGIARPAAPARRATRSPRCRGRRRSRSDRGSSPGRGRRWRRLSAAGARGSRPTP